MKNKRVARVTDRDGVQRSRRYWSVAEFCEVIDRSPYTAQRGRSEGDGPPYLNWFTFSSKTLILNAIWGISSPDTGSAPYDAKDMLDFFSSAPRLRPSVPCVARPVRVRPHPPLTRSPRRPKHRRPW